MRSWPAAFVGLCALLVGVALARIVSTYHVFNQTWDEAAHIGGGMELLDRGTYTYEPMHPPLPRVMAALGPYLDGARSQGDRNRDIEGNRILHSLGTYDRTLALARLGILPFFILAAAVVALWARELYGLGGALWALLLFTTLPPILAHAGLATTDIAATGTIALTLYLWSRWLDFPSAGRSAALGIALGLAILSKLSALLFLPVGALVILASRQTGGRADGRTDGPAVDGGVVPPTVRPPDRLTARPTARPSARLIIYLAAFLTIWSGYRFSVGSLVPPAVPAWADAPSPPSPPSPPSLTDRFVLRIERAPIYPAPELFQGFVALFKKNLYGHRAYLLGEVRATGWWYFFPVALAVKTPLGFLALFAVGLGVLARSAVRRRDWNRLAPGLVAVSFVLVAMSSGINIGLRHVLPAYPFMALAAGAGAVALWGWRRFRPLGPVAAALLAGWTVVSSARAHPDYLAYFNELAGSRPERILVDSDLDWGQDLDRLADTLRARGIAEISIAYNGSADITRHGLPAFRELRPFQPTAGWIAVSLFCLKLGKVGTPTPDEFAWLERFTPVARVGRSILLYHLTDAELPYHHPIGRPQ